MAATGATTTIVVTRTTEEPHRTIDESAEKRRGKSRGISVQSVLLSSGRYLIFPLTPRTLPSFLISLLAAAISMPLLAASSSGIDAYSPLPVLVASAIRQLILEKLSPTGFRPLSIREKSAARQYLAHAYVTSVKTLVVSFPVSLGADRKHRGSRGRSPAIVTASLGRARARGTFNGRRRKQTPPRRTLARADTFRHSDNSGRGSAARDSKKRATFATGWLIDCASTRARTPRGVSPTFGAAPLSAPRSPDVASRRRRRLVDTHGNTLGPLVLAGLAYTCGQNSAVLNSSSPSRSLSRSTHVRARAPSGRDWPRRHVRPPLPNMAVCQSLPPPPPLYATVAEDARRNATIVPCFAELASLARPLVSAKRASPVTFDRRQMPIDPAILDPPREICYDSTPPKSRALRAARSSESAPNAADSRSSRSPVFFYTWPSRSFSLPVSLGPLSLALAGRAREGCRWRKQTEYSRRSARPRESGGPRSAEQFFFTFRTIHTVLRCRQLSLIYAFAPPGTYRVSNWSRSGSQKCLAILSLCQTCATN